MSTWTNIPDDALEPSKPIRSVDAIALRDNPVAIAEGAAGAPRVQVSANQPPTAGGNFVLCNLLLQTRGTSNEAYVDPRAPRTEDANRHFGVSVLRDGVIRASFEHRFFVSGASGGRTAEARVLLNGVQVALWGTASTGFVLRQVDINVQAGDLVIFQQRLVLSLVNDSRSEWRNLRILSNIQSLAVNA